MFRNVKNEKILDLDYLHVGIVPLKVVSFRICAAGPSPVPLLNSLWNTHFVTLSSSTHPAGRIPAITYVSVSHAQNPANKPVMT